MLQIRHDGHESCPPGDSIFNNIGDTVQCLRHCGLEGGLVLPHERPLGFIVRFCILSTLRVARHTLHIVALRATPIQCLRHCTVSVAHLRRAILWMMAPWPHVAVPDGPLRVATQCQASPTHYRVCDCMVVTGRLFSFHSMMPPSRLTTL